MRCLTVLVMLATSAGVICAEENKNEQIRAAVQKTVPWLEKGAAGSSAHNQCFTCHNHGLPIIALTEAKKHGLEVDEENRTAQIEHTLAFLKSGEDRYRDGKGQGGRVLTAGYALWALHASGQQPDETTAIVADYLLTNQSDKSHWMQGGRRPPSDGNEFTVTYVALKSLHSFCREERSTEKDGRFTTVGDWLAKTPPKDTESSVFRLKSLRLVKPEGVASAVDELLKQQQPDGGWAQTPDMKSDAYATGSVLSTLLDEGELKPDHEAVRAALTYLLDTQLDDGTWRVVTRADGFQPYYESGFPHEEDQFISMAASCWASIALLRSLPSPDELSERTE